MSPPPRTGVVLAGGRGQRMGADKPLLRTDGRTLLSRALDALRPHCGELLVMGGPHAARLAPHAAGARVLADPGEGPHVALRLAARIARHPTILVAPADAPRLAAEAYAPLLHAGPDARHVLDGVPNPLLGIYHRETLRGFEGRSLQGIAARDVHAPALATLLADADEPQDLKRLG